MLREEDYIFGPPYQRDRMVPFDPDYYMGGLFNDHMKETLRKTVLTDNRSLSLLGPNKIALEMVEHAREKKPLRIAEIKIEDIGEDIFADVRTKLFDEIRTYEKDTYVPSVYKKVPRITYFDREINDAKMDNSGNYCVEVQSYMSEDDDVKSRGNRNAWNIFQTQGVSVIDSSSCRVYGNKKYFKLIQNYKLTATKLPIIAYIQFICAVRKVKYCSNWYDYGDIITLFVKHKFSPQVPAPPLICVQPRESRTIIPLLPKQSMQIVTTSNMDMEFRLISKNSSLKYLGCNASDRIYRSDFFECQKISNFCEFLTVNSRIDNKVRTIVVPKIHSVKNKHYAIIDDPKECVIYCGNIDGLIFKSYSDLPLRVVKDCPIQLIYALDKDDYYETKMKLTGLRSYVRIIKENNNLLIKC
jgi:hypothetical protein